jgi:SAM-dependent methyltransferase
MTTPGHCPDELIQVKEIYLFKRFSKFVKPYGSCCDISPKNAKMEYIKQQHGIEVFQYTSQDYNDCVMPVDSFDTIFLFEVIEHLTDPKWFLKQVRNALREGGTLYLSYTSRPKFLWPDFHYYEIPPDIFEKWLLEPLGFEIIRRKRIRKLADMKWYQYFGVRPMIRLIFRIFYNFTTIYEIRQKNQITGQL